MSFNTSSKWRLSSILVALAAGGADAAAADLPTCDAPPTASARVTDVLDGDTIETSQGVVRLAGIEAPRGGDFGNPTLAAAARAALGDLVRGQTVTIAAIGENPDRYGRIHAHVFAEDQRWMQAALVDLGMARVRPLIGEEACIALLFDTEARARAEKKGVWAGVTDQPVPANDPSLSRKIGLYAIVEGRILSVGFGTAMVFLDFGHNYRRDFTVMIPKRLEQQFVEAGKPMASFKGKRVRVRGMVEESGGPAIRLQHPMAIELLGE